MAPIEQSAHHRRGDGRRADGRQVLRRRRGRAGVQRGRAADAAHAGRAARPRRQAADRRARHAGRRRASDGAARWRGSIARGGARWLRCAGRAALRCDSRRVGAGDAFVAWPGDASDGRRYVGAALARRRDAPAWSRPRASRRSASTATARRRAARAEGGRRRRSPAASSATPSEQLDVIAVTGTNGKTSTAWWVAQALAALGRRCGVIGTLGIGKPPAPAALGRRSSTGLTTPDPMTLQSALRRFATAASRPARSRRRRSASPNSASPARRSRSRCSPTSPRTTWTITATWRLLAGQGAAVRLARAARRGDQPRRCRRASSWPNSLAASRAVDCWTGLDCSGAGAAAAPRTSRYGARGPASSTLSKASERCRSPRR